MAKHINPPETPTSALLNLVLNIILPVWILKNMSLSMGPIPALFLALSLPVGYFLYEYIKVKRRNWISVLGFLNTLVTGSFAIMQLEGIWFAFKEAFFPLMIGVFVYLSAYVGKRAFVQFLFMNPALFQVDLLEQKLKENNKEKEFKKHLIRNNTYLSLSFLMSAILNFILGIYVFTEIPAHITGDERSIILNEQISEMTWMGYIVIFVPSMICLLLIFRHLTKGINRFTGLTLNDIMVKN